MQIEEVPQKELQKMFDYGLLGYNGFLSRRLQPPVTSDPLYEIQEAQLAGGSVLVGEGKDVDQIIAGNASDGLWIGDAEQPDAPFSVDMDGNMKATSITDAEGNLKTSLKNLTNGEALSALDYVYIEDSGLVYMLREYHSDTGSNNQNIGDAVAHQQMAQSFTVSERTRCARILLQLGETGHAGVSPGTVRVDIETDNAGEPSGTNAWTGSYASMAQYSNLPSSGFSAINFDLGASGYFETGTTYWWRVRQTASGSDPYINASQYLRVRQVDNSDTYANGVAKEDNNGTWTSYARDQFFSIYDQTVQGQVYKANAVDTDHSDGAIGIVTSAYSLESTNVDVQVLGKVSGFSGLTVGKAYYLSDSDGQISSTPGTISKKVGFAVSSTELILIQT